MKQTISNYVHGHDHWTVVHDTSNNMFYVECRHNGFLTKSIPFLSENEATNLAQQHGTTTQQLLRESN